MGGSGLHSPSCRLTTHINQNSKLSSGTIEIGFNNKAFRRAGFEKTITKSEENTHPLPYIGKRANYARLF